MNGQVDTGAVNFFAKFLDLMIWLSFQKEGTTNPAPTITWPSTSTSSDEERVWRDVVQAIDRNMLTASSTSFSLSGDVHMIMDLPSNLITMDDDASDGSNDEAHTPQITDPSPAPPLGTERSWDQQAEPLRTHVSIRLMATTINALQMI